jgi:prepilin-type N-terminal cleavage/methylation domain-containing protein
MDKDSSRGLLPKTMKGFTFIELLVTLVVILILSAIGITNLMDAQKRSKSARAASDTRTAVTQCIVYATDRGMYPASLLTLRTTGYASLPDNDPWSRPYVLAQLLASSAMPGPADDVYVYSGGARGAGTYQPSASDCGQNGAVGYSSLYGSFQGGLLAGEAVTPLPGDSRHLTSTGRGKTHRGEYGHGGHDKHDGPGRSRKGS